jgi:hypothetical protein
VFIDSVGSTSNAGCIAPTSFGPKSITFGPPPSGNYNQFAFRVNCT